MYDFLRNIFLLYSINWPNFIVWLLLLLEILSNMCTVFIYCPVCDVKNFEIARSLIKRYKVRKNMQIFHDFAIVRLRFWFRKVLIKNIRIINTLYAAMGSPLSPTSANSLACYHEKAWSDKCPEEFNKPVLHSRYVKDISVVFRKGFRKLFLNYFNSCQENI